MSDELDFTSYEDAVDVIGNMMDRAMSEVPAALSATMVEQIRAAARDHLTEAGCDPRDSVQVKAAVCGALMTLALQAQASPLMVGTVILAQALVDLERGPDDTEDWFSIVDRLMIKQEPEVYVMSRLDRFKEGVLELVARALSLL